MSVPHTCELAASCGIAGCSHCRGLFTFLLVVLLYFLLIRPLFLFLEFSHIGAGKGIEL
jgi:hypothetical protein